MASSLLSALVSSLHGEEATNSQDNCHMLASCLQYSEPGYRSRGRKEAEGKKAPQDRRCAYSPHLLARLRKLLRNQGPSRDQADKSRRRPGVCLVSLPAKRKQAREPAMTTDGFQSKQQP
ncbi:uncharacterized protein TrAtP1_012863 [Trichoderma atroviride]|uniref:uncharacterized protein n=1 Tax=Hypocrea atroviridis TaxID=63577 RepID=UPI003331B442|nr:hypothetical protein TrAtP1_012863 [Trichoderma atroviride]